LLGIVNVPEGVDKQFVHCSDIFGEETHGSYLVELIVGLNRRQRRLGKKLFAIISIMPGHPRETGRWPLKRLLDEMVPALIYN
jgi:hypothetical protein